MSGWTFDERFKAWAEREAMPLVTANNTLEVVTSKHMEAAFLGGVSSRDAEVQELRQALTEVTNELEAEVNHRYGFDPATGEVKGLARRYEVDISVVRMARAVLAGEEATDE